MKVKRKKNEHIPNTDIPIQIGWDFSEDPLASQNTAGNLLFNFYSGCEQKKTLSCSIWLWLKSKARPAKDKFTSSPQRKRIPCAMEQNHLSFFFFTWNAAKPHQELLKLWQTRIREYAASLQLDTKNSSKQNMLSCSKLSKQMLTMRMFIWM